MKKTRNLWNPQDANGEVGVTLLLSGLLCREGGNSTQEVINWFTKVGQLLRQNDNKPMITLPIVGNI
ncbi:MAG: hypothetical protein WBA13_09495 [Microcoleaceae cyanobacterium]